MSTQASFDDLLIPSDHVIRSPRDTYYVDEFTVLRPHTSAHQTEVNPSIVIPVIPVVVVVVVLIVSVSSVSFGSLW